MYRVFMQGQWKQISRYYVPTRTPTQVASHAQKHFLRQAGSTKRRSKFAAVEHDYMVNLSSQDGSGSGSRSRSRSDDSRHIDAGILNKRVPGDREEDGSLVGGKGRRGGAMDGVVSYGGGKRQKGGGFANSDFLLMHGRALPSNGMEYSGVMRPTISIPPVNANGMALGIPLPELPELESYDTGTNSKIPMLKVLPGRIRAMTAMIRPSSPSPSQTKLTKNELDDVAALDIVSPHHRKRPRKARRRTDDEYQHQYERGDMHSSALDALAGIAVALAAAHENDIN